MIEIEEVCPSAREGRPIRRGWGSIHWVCLLPTHAFLLGFLAFGILVTVSGDHDVPEGAFSALLVGSWLLWWLGSLLVRASVLAEARKSPTGGLSWKWKIDSEGFTFSNGLQTNRLDWRAIRSVREEKDRFLFLVSPAYNPVLPTRLLTDAQLDVLRGMISTFKTSGRLGGVDYPPPSSDKA